MGETQQVLRYPCHPYTKKLLSAAPSPFPRK
ncbi:MAG: ATP-binding cassette domain-containing protein, partial [Sulfitobacter geojensis]